jgi:hypothetical protein
MFSFDEGVDSNKCSEGLGFYHFYVQSPCKAPIEDYTEIFYMIDEGNVPSVQCKMRLRGPKCTRKVDGLSLIFIYVYVPVLIRSLKSTETSLQLSENIPFFAVCRKYIYVSSTKRPR